MSKPDISEMNNPFRPSQYIPPTVSEDKSFKDDKLADKQNSKPQDINYPHLEEIPKEENVIIASNQQNVNNGNLNQPYSNINNGNLHQPNSNINPQIVSENRNIQNQMPEPFPNPPDRIQHEIIIVEQNRNEDPYVVRELIVLKEKDAHTIPHLPFCVALTIFLLNIFLPGMGTIMLACFSEKHAGYWICIGLAQFFLTCIIFGYIWSIITGVQVLCASLHHHHH